MDTRVVQIPVLKQGVWEKGNWSTRILTIDVATGTATVSRHKHPKNILYHSIQLDLVQMWPHFTQRDLEDYIRSINAKMTLRLIGKVVPVPDFSNRHLVNFRPAAAAPPATTAGTASAAGSPSQPTSKTSAASGAAVPSAEIPSISTDYGFIAGDCTKKRRHVETTAVVSEAWMLRFTTYQSYELALMLIAAMKNEKGQPKQLLGNTADHDLDVIRQAWVREGGAAGINAETATI